MDREALLSQVPFGWSRREKQASWISGINELTKFHFRSCEPYRKVVSLFGYRPESRDLAIEDLPFLPVRIFKEFELMSVDRSDISKTITSSGTSGTKPSRIFLDRETAHHQTKALTRIVTDFIGPHRIPLLVLDSPSVIKNRAEFSARGAGVLGFSIFGSEMKFAFDDEMQLQFSVIKEFADKHQNQKILIFGFTSMVWQYFIRNLEERKINLPLHHGILIHGGGWKKLEAEKVSGVVFKERLAAVSGISSVHNYYGLAEQVGSIFMECTEGVLHCSNYSEIFIRRNDFSLANKNEKGFIQLLSLLPRSYPGHNLITEDVGEILGEDDCRCRRLGKYFRVEGRVKEAEVRGCSDAYTAV